ncbi:HlyD family type I secretion periplasmic adaptor subunit [Magnetovibrio sp. PR-2]|uniref:HlyD family type I secretion periplasmic adaptor subunit n=1 Tax=Magnetovibrio sp. PR-2 TaxID=3120356 RepID=UPI002FCE2E36
MKKPELDISRETHLFLITMIGAFFLFFIWSFVGRLDVVSFAQGEVVPSSQVKTVQHLEGGIIADILVREGDRVKAGQPLVALEATASGADVQELSVRMTALIADIARLQAEVDNTEIVFPEGFEAEHSIAARQAVAMYDNRKRQFENDLAGQVALIEQRLNESGEIQARLANTREKLTLLQEQVAISEDLLKDDLTNRMLHLNLLKEVANLEGMISEDTSAEKRLAAAIEQERLSKEGIENRFRIEARQELDDKKRSLEEFTNRVRKFEDSFQRSVLTSPVEGVVMTLHVVTRGGVIQPGGAVVDVVPMGDAMVVEAQLPPQDVGYVHVGQPARVQLASADGGRFDHLNGTVSHISPDTVETQDGSTYYKVRIKTDRDHFRSGGETYRLVPGVQVMCSIVTGSRSVMDYMASPFIGSFSTAMQER